MSDAFASSVSFVVLLATDFERAGEEGFEAEVYTRAAR
jgi:hypothetical protein